MVYWLISFILYSIGITIAYIITDRSRTKAVRKFRGMQQYLDKLNAQGLLPPPEPKPEPKSLQSDQVKSESLESDKTELKFSESDKAEPESSESNKSEPNDESSQLDESETNSESSEQKSESTESDQPESESQKSEIKSKWTLPDILNLDKYVKISDFIHGSIFDYGNWFSIIGLALSFSIFMVIPILISLLGFFRSKRLSKRIDYFAKAGIIVGLCKIGLLVLYGVCIVGLIEGQAGMRGYFSSLISFTRIADFYYNIKTAEPAFSLF